MAINFVVLEKWPAQRKTTTTGMKMLAFAQYERPWTQYRILSEAKYILSVAELRYRDRRSGRSACPIRAISCGTCLLVVAKIQTFSRRCEFPENSKFVANFLLASVCCIQARACQDKKALLMIHSHVDHHFQMSRKWW